MLRKNWVAILFLTIVITACRPAEKSADSSSATATSTQTDEAAIKQVFRQFVDKWNAADLDGVMATMADNFVEMPPGNPMIIGKEPLRSSYEQFLSKNSYMWKATIESIEMSGDLAIVRDSFTESWTPNDGSETKTVIGKGMKIFRRGADGSWRMVNNIWNANEGSPYQVN